MKLILISGKAQHGKDSTANILSKELKANGKHVLIAHFGDLVKYVCKQFFDWNGEKDNYGRSLLQRVGTDEVRKQYPNFWVDFIKNILTVFNDWDYVLIPDCRFPNEVEMFNNFDKIAIRINRTNYISELTEEQQNHPSETSLDNYQFDYVINSKSGLDYLEKEVKRFLEVLLDGKT